MDRRELMTADQRRIDIPWEAGAIYRLGDRLVNWWLVVERDAAVLVDAGLPGHHTQLEALLPAIGLGDDSIQAVVVTHGHIDHLSCIAVLRDRRPMPVHVPAGDRDLAATKPRLDPSVVAHSLNPAGIRAASSYVRQGVLRALPVVDANDLVDGEVLDLPGRLRFVCAPGHTEGGGIFVHEGGQVAFTGDVLVTLDPFSGRTGPRTLPAFDNVDHPLAVESLRHVAATGAATILPGHGEPWHHGAAEAARVAVATDTAGR